MTLGIFLWLPIPGPQSRIMSISPRTALSLVGVAIATPAQGQLGERLSWPGLVENVPVYVVP